MIDKMYLDKEHTYFPPPRKNRYCLAIPPATVLHCGNVWRSVLVSLELGIGDKVRGLFFKLEMDNLVSEKVFHRSSRKAELCMVSPW